MKKILLVGTLLAALCASSLAAVTANSPITAQTPNRGLVQFLPASTPGVYAVLYTAGANGSNCYGMWETNSDSATHLLTVQVFNATIGYGGFSITTTATAGYANAALPQNLMLSTNWVGLPVDQNGNPFLRLVSGDTLQATYATAVTTAKVLNVFVTCDDF